MTSPPFRDFSLLLDAITQPIFVHDSTFNVIYANKAYVKLAQKSLKQIIDHPYWLSFPKGDGPTAGCLDALKCSCPIHEEIQTTKGKTFLSYSFPVVIDQQYRHSVHILEDVSEKKRILQRLEEDKNMLDTIVEGAVDGLFVHDQHGRFVKVNQAACKSLGYSREDLLKMSVFDVEKGISKQKLNKLWKAAQIGEPIILSGVHHRKDGTEFPVEVHIGLLKFKGQPRLLAIVRDMSEHQRYEKNLESMLYKTIEAMMHITEQRDPYTAGHQLRVAALAKAIAQKMQLSDDNIWGIYLGALIHDIGKIHIPAEILTSPKTLSKETFELIKHHPKSGYEIIENIPFIWPIKEIILQHHERLDGSGYPYGLKGNAIHMCARIVAVADVYEAMVSHRPYRPRRTKAEAIAELEQHAGSRYDAEVVKQCIALVKGKRFRFPSTALPTQLFSSN